MAELLAPAGNFESLKSAVFYGADAVYLGLGKFNARIKADGFNEENLIEAIKYCHLRNVKVYLTLNTLIKQDELDAFFEVVKFAYNCNIDAIILQDISLGAKIHKMYPSLALHASTQMGICNSYGAKIAKDVGFTRIILARETTLEDIVFIKKNVDIEIEYFVHGALCVSFSGNCYFSAILGGNSGNRGRCKQPCRQKYALSSKKFKKTGYLLSTKDLCLDKHIEKLIACGVDSFKIEGRLKRPEYVGQAVKYYKNIVKDKLVNDAELKKLKKMFNRGNFSNGYLFARKSEVIYPNIQNHIGVFAGKITRQVGEKLYFGTDEEISLNDGLKILRNGFEVGGGVVVSKENAGYYILADNAKVGDSVNITSDTKLIEGLSKFSNYLPIDIEFFFHLDENIVINAKNYSFSTTIDIMPVLSRTVSLSKEEVEIAFSKLNDTNFVLNSISGKLDSNIFLPKSKLNEVRRRFVCELEAFLLKQYFVNEIVNDAKYVKANIDCCSALKDISAAMFADYSSCEKSNKLYDILICKPSIYTVDSIREFFEKSTVETYLYLPTLLTEEDFALIKSIVKELSIKKVYVENLSGVLFAKEINADIFCGVMLNIFNSENIDFLINYGAKYFAVSKELRLSELKWLKNAFVVTNGAFEIMKLGHCPLINSTICACNNCEYDNTFNYIDEENRIFPIMRTKICECSFSVYNNSLLSVDENLIKKASLNCISDFSLLGHSKMYDMPSNAGLIKRGIE